MYLNLIILTHFASRNNPACTEEHLVRFQGVL